MIPFPSVNIDDYLRQAATDIITILTSPPSTTTPTLQAGDPVRNALLELATLLNRAKPLPKLSSPPPSNQPTNTTNTSVPRVSFPNTTTTDNDKYHNK